MFVLQLRIQAEDRGYPVSAKTALTLIIIVQDKNDHKPEFPATGRDTPHELRVFENSCVSCNDSQNSCVNVSLAVDQDVNATFTRICYYIVGQCSNTQIDGFF